VPVKGYKIHQATQLKAKCTLSLTSLVKNIFSAHLLVGMLLSYTWSLCLLLSTIDVSGLPLVNSTDSDVIEHQDNDKTDNDNIDNDNQTTSHYQNHSLLTVIETRPHSMSIMIKPKDYKPDTMIRLLYERVPAHRQPFMHHLDDPVIEYIPLTRRVQSHDLAELPKGKYIVCGEAMVQGEVYQSSCFDTKIERLDSNSELRDEGSFYLNSFV
jgi:hypothetical protein